MSPQRPVPWLAGRLPRWWRAGLGVVLVLLGVWLLSRPLSSLTLLALYLGLTLLLVGAGEAVAARRDRTRVRVGVLWAVVGLFAVAAPGWTVLVLPYVVAVALVVSGVLRVLRARRSAGTRRWAPALLGAAELVLAVVTLLVPDVALVLVALLFGLRAVVLGAQLVLEALLPWRTRREAAADDASGSRWARAVPVLGGALALTLSLGVLSVVVVAELASPHIDDFYSADEFGEDELAEPGRLLRSEEFGSEVPEQARAWRILYATVDHEGRPTTASGIVSVPRTRPLTGGRPVLAWAHGTTGQARRCAPSLLDEPFTAGAFPEVMDEVVERGWAVVATDYVGLGAEGTHAYLVGNVAGTAVLDSVRAARQLEEAEVSDDTVVWGHSQGGAAALWAAQLQPEHAPDVPLLGTVAMAPAADVPELADTLGDVAGGSLFASFVATGYSSAYDDVRLRDAVRPPALGLVRRMSARCLAEPGVVASVLTALSMRDEDVLKAGVTRGAMGERLSQNAPTSPARSPLWVAQGGDDGLVTPEVQGSYVQRVRRAGGELEYTVHDGLDHTGLVQEGSELLPQLLRWTEARFAGR